MGSIKLEGFSELDKALAEIAKKTTSKALLRRALKKAAEPIAEFANRLAPVGETGGLAKSFVYSTKLNKRQAGIHRKMFRNDKAAVEGFVGSNDPAAVQQEFGNQNHGPQAAMRPAWDADKNALLDRLGNEIKTDLDKTVAREARKAAKLARG